MKTYHKGVTMANIIVILHISHLYHSDDDFKHSVAESIAKQLEEISVSNRYHN